MFSWLNDASSFKPIAKRAPPYRDGQLAPREASSRFYSIEFCRGLAATLVVFHHAGDIMAEPRFFGAQPFNGLFQNFNVGVDFFFVLSGFIITWVHARDIGNPAKLKPFLVRRFTRIYPPYWGVLFPLIFLYAVMPSAGIPSQHDPVNIAMSILLLPWTQPPVLGVAWTLVREVIFYALFACALTLGKRAMLLFPVWALIIVGVNLAATGPVTNVLFDAFNLEFVFGMFAAWYLLRYRVRYPALLIVAGGCVFVFAMLFLRHLQDVPLQARLLYGGASLVALLGMVELERRNAYAAGWFVRLFGSASYSIYLVHPVALSLAIQILVRLYRNGGEAFNVAALVFVGVSAGVLYHLLVEKPLTQAVRGWTARRRTPPVREGGRP